MTKALINKSWCWTKIRNIPKMSWFVPLITSHSKNFEIILEYTVSLSPSGIHIFSFLITFFLLLSNRHIYSRVLWVWLSVDREVLYCSGVFFFLAYFLNCKLVYLSSLCTMKQLVQSYHHSPVNSPVVTWMESLHTVCVLIFLYYIILSTVIFRFVYILLFFMLHLFLKN